MPRGEIRQALGQLFGKGGAAEPAAPAMTIDQVEAEIASGRTLAGANLAGADLTGARLAGADLQGVNLQGSSLREADLSGAQSATLSFDYDYDVNFDDDTLVRLQISSNGGASYTTLRTFSDSTSGSGTYSQDGSAWISAATRIRFLVADGDPTEDLPVEEGAEGADPGARAPGEEHARARSSHRQADDCRASGRHRLPRRLHRRRAPRPAQDAAADIPHTG